MLFRILADSIVLIHFLWILFLIFGGIWGIRNTVLKIFHISGLVLAIIIQTLDLYCPLTYLEIWLREKSNPLATYKGSFIIHYVEKAVYIDISHGLIILLTFLLSGFNVWLYLVRGRKK